jgi:hypothetical protein
MKAKKVAAPKRKRRVVTRGKPQNKKREHLSKTPRAPVFPPRAVPLINLLNKIIDDGLNKVDLAMGILERLHDLYTPPIMPERFTVGADLIEYHEDRPGEARVRLSPDNPPLTNELLTMMMQLFPNGEGLPPQEGTNPL